MLSLCLLAAIGATSVSAALSGTYTIGGAAPNYATIDLAIADLNAQGVSGPVTFAIRSGTYTPPAGGYILGNIPSMTAVNTVTFRPDVGASVTIDGNINLPIFDINQGHNFIFEGWSGSGPVTQTLRIMNRSTGATANAIRFINTNAAGTGASNNVVTNCVVIGNSTSSSTGGVIYIATSLGGTGNNNNIIQSNTIGDAVGVVSPGVTFLRANKGVDMLGTATRNNTNNLVDNNEIINLGSGALFHYGIYVQAQNEKVRISNNRIHVTNTAGTSGVWPLYGIYWTNSTAAAVGNENIIDNNRIWDLQAIQTTNSQTYGIYLLNSSASTLYVRNNMISLNGDQNAHTHYGIYVGTVTTNPIEIDNNSIDVRGTVSAAQNAYCLFMSSTQTVTARNNIFSQRKATNGAVISHCISRTATTGTWTSNNNCFFNSGTGTNLGAIGATNHATLSAWQAATAKDANSRVGNPQFINPVIADLHINVGTPTPVEAGAAPIAGAYPITVDIDGNARNVTTPDIGADEGNFTPLPPNDIAAVAFVNPATGGTKSPFTTFGPTATVTNAGTATQTNVNVRYRIRDSGSTIVYEDIQTVASIAANATPTVTFNAVGNQSGTTSQPVGGYTIELTTLLAGDAAPANDQITGTLNVMGPLSGTYTINKTGGGFPNFTSFTSAITTLNGVGVSGPVTFVVANDTYTSSTETFPLTLGNVPSMSAANTVTFRPAVGATAVIDGNNATPVIEINQGHHFILNGWSGTGPVTQSLTIINRNTGATANTIRFINTNAAGTGASNNVVTNCVVIGNSTSSSTGGVIYIATSLGGTGNSNNVIQSNTVGDAAGLLRANKGIDMLGTSTRNNTNNLIDNNEVINMGSGALFHYGIYVQSQNEKVRISNNRIHVTNTTGTSGVWPLYGIYWTNTTAAAVGNENIIDNNRIWDLQAIQTTNSSTYGIYLLNSSASTLYVRNNMISLNGDQNAHTHYGIYVGTLTTNPIEIDNNSIDIRGTVSAAQTAYCLFMSSTQTVTARNNAFSQRKITNGAVQSHCVSRTAITGTWNEDFNCFFNSGTGTNVGAIGATVHNSLSAWQAATAKDANSKFGDPRFINPAAGDLHISTSLSTMVESGGTPIAGAYPITLDIDGNARNATTPDIGADEGNFVPVFANDMAPLAFVNPANGGVKPASTLFSPSASFINTGTASQTNVTVRYRIINASAVEVYNNTQVIASLGSGAQTTVTFNSAGTSLPAGTYTIEAASLLAGDQFTGNDVITGTLQVKPPLNGVYTIDKLGGGPTNYVSFTLAVADVVSLGVAGPVTFRVASSTYNNTTETFPFVLGPVASMSAVNTVTFKPAASATVIVDGTSSTLTLPIFDINGGSYYIIDGWNGNGGVTQNMTIINRSTSNLTTAQAVRLTNGASNNTVKNCIAMTASTAGSYPAPTSVNHTGVISVGSTSTTAACMNNLVQNNILGDAAGALRTCLGVYLAGSAAFRTFGTTVDGNEMLNQGTAAAIICGVYVDAGTEKTRVVGNRIHVTNTSGTGTVWPNYGIFYRNTTTPAAGNEDIFENNRIWDINGTSSGSGETYGMHFFSSGTARIFVRNNSISLNGDGAGVAHGIIYGIRLENSNSYDLDFNSIEVFGTTATASNSACLFVQSSPSVNVRNNVLSQRRPAAASNYSVSKATGGAFATNYNAFFNSGAGTNLGLVAGTTYANLAAWQGAGYDLNSVFGNPNFVNTATCDLHIQPGVASSVAGAGAPVAGISLDADGQTRNASRPDIGVDEYNNPITNATAPVVSGTNAVGGTLSTTNGTWNDVDNDIIVYTYSWQRANDGMGAGAVQIGTAANLTLTVAEAHKYIRVTVTANDGNGSSAQASSPWVQVQNSVPVNTVPPVFSGVYAVTQTLNMTNGTWTDGDTDPITYSYLWESADDLVGTNPVQIGTNSSYTIVPADSGRYIRGTLTANDGFGGVMAVSSSWELVVNQAPINTVPPAVSGVNQVGGTLSTTDGTWIDHDTDPLTFTYLWERADDAGGTNPVTIGTNSSVFLTPDEARKYTRVTITCDDAHGHLVPYSTPWVQLINVAPVADSQTITTSEDTTITGIMVATDNDFDPLTYTIIGNGTLGTATITDINTGAFVYVPTPNASGVDLVTFIASDLSTNSNTATVTVNVTPVSDQPPLGVSDSAGTEGALIPLDIQTGLVDEDGSEILAITISGLPGNAALNFGTDLGGGVWSVSALDLIGLGITVADDTVFTLSVVVTSTEMANGDSTLSSDVLLVTVANVEPTIDLTGQMTNNSVDLYFLTLGAIHDPGTDTVTQYIVHWGDGSTDTFGVPAPTTISHSYVAGTISPVIRVDLVDEDGLHLDCGVLQAPGFSNDVFVVEAQLGDAFVFDFVSNAGLQGSPLPLIEVSFVELPANVASIGDIGLALSGTQMVSSQLLKAGQVSITLTATNLGGVKVINLLIKIMHPSGGSETPRFLSNPTATPNPVQVGVEVAFTAVVTDADGDILAFSWEFGDGTYDGTKDRRLTTTHTFTQPGTYNVSLVVEDDQHSIFRHMTINVVGEANLSNYRIATFKLSFDFKNPARSQLVIVGSVPIPASQPQVGATVNVSIPDGYSQDFVLNSKFTGGDNTSLFSLKVTAPGATQNIAKFTLHLKGIDASGVSLFDRLTGLGYLNKKVNPAILIVMPLVIRVPAASGGEQTNINTMYKAVQGKSGKATQAK